MPKFTVTSFYSDGHPIYSERTENITFSESLAIVSGLFENVITDHVIVSEVNDLDCSVGPFSIINRPTTLHDVQRADCRCSYDDMPVWKYNRDVLGYDEILDSEELLFAGDFVDHLLSE